jgi:aminoglycoside phosphotransferase (APT) family kinase protein
MPIQVENSAIPETHSAAVLQALAETFGVTAVDELTDLTERAGSNRAFRILVAGRAYMLRINTRRGDVARQFTCMRMAAEAGLTPRVWYTSDEDRVSITDFVNALPLSAAEAIRHLPVALRILHALPQFPPASFNTTCTFLLHQGPMLDGFLKKFQTESPLPKREIEQVLTQYLRIVDAYAPPASDIVPSHNDLFKPDNILFDGSRPWLIDSEASFPNDRFADLAAVANMLATDEQDERAFLQTYFAAPPTPYQQARLHLMRQLAHMFYAMAFLAGSSPEKLAALNEPEIPYSEFQARFWSRELVLSDDRPKATFSRVHWQELLHNLRQPRYEEALPTVRIPPPEN